MQPADSDDLVVSTPERVAFQYPVAGLGSRFLAQLIDMAVLILIFLVFAYAGASLGKALNNSGLTLLILLLVSFVLLFGYFLISEAIWSGQTIGKRALRLRVVGDRGEPLRFNQAVTRNLVRVVDFLPLMYAVGIITVFANRRNKRLGDFAAGTLVVRERQRVSLFDLASAAPAALAPQAPAPSIWDRPAPPAPGAGTITASGPPKPMDPALRRLVVAYAARRSDLPMARRQAVAARAAAALRAALPDVVAAAGPLAALDQLAEAEGVTPARRMHPQATGAMTLGIISLALCVFFYYVFEIFAMGFGIVTVLLARNALRAIRARPHELRGEDRAKTARLLGFLGVGIAAVILLFQFLAVVGSGS